MAELSDEDYEAACERGRVEFKTQPHAARARYDRATGMLVPELYSGCVFSVPARELQGLEAASDDELAAVELLGVGAGVHWESRDADFSVEGLMAGRFGTAQSMAPRRARLRAMLEKTLGDRRDAA